MSVDTKTEAEQAEDLEKIRKWVDEKRIAAPPEAPKEPAVHDPKPEQPVLKAPREISAGAKLTQKIIESMDLRRQERARLVAALKSREVEVEREDLDARKRLAAVLAELRDEYDRRIHNAQDDCTGGVQVRRADLEAKRRHIDQVDHALAQLRKQLDAELSKLDPERKGGA